jgi:hypothetical protein
MKDLEKFPEASWRKIVIDVLSGTMSKERARQIYGIKSKSAQPILKIALSFQKDIPHYACESSVKKCC